MQDTIGRRHALRLLGGAAGIAILAACGSKSGSSASNATTATTANNTNGTSSTDDTSTSSGECATIPQETAGPFPGDGSNGPDVLSMDGVVRKDITKSIGDASGVAAGVPLTLALTVLDASGCTPLANAAVYAWHCDRDGNYSMYDGGAANENYLRGVQPSDANGLVTFTSIYPAAYSGRWPHVHFEVYESVDAATSGGSPIATSQLAFPEDTCNAVYATDGYAASVQNMQQLSLASDNVFSDGWDTQLATMSGDVQSGYTAKLNVPVGG